MAKLKEILNDIKAGWEGLDKKKRTRLITIVSVVLVSLFFIVYFTQRTDYSILFSELEDEDAGIIVEDLEDKNIPYKLEDNGSTILIDKKQIDTYRIELAVDGLLPATTTGFEIFDGGNLMATDQDRAVMYQRAVTGELERAISSLKNVKKGKVLLNLPEESIFENPEYRKDASASVILEMANNHTPDASTIQGITSLVSGAVENLPAEQVKIVDTNGRLLSSNVSSENAGNVDIVNEHQLIKRSIEQDLEQKVISLLSPIYGIDKVQISVNADLNFDHIEREIVEYGEEAIRSQSEDVIGNAALAGQVQAGILDENTPTVFEDEEDSDGTSYHHTTNYELDTTTSKVIEAPGAINHIIASVIILDNPNNEAGIQQLVENALGIPTVLNLDEDDDYPLDEVIVEFMPIRSDEEEEAIPVFDGGEFAKDLLAWLKGSWWMVLIGLVLLIIILLAIRAIRRRRSGEDEEEEYTEFVDITTEVPEVEEEKPEENIEDLLNLANEKEDQIRNHAKDNPEVVAELIKIWMKEEN